MIEKLEKLKDIKISKKTQIKIYIVSIFLLMLFLNILTPLIADDYSYALNINNERLNGLKDIFVYQLDHYLTWGGRTVAHTIGQIFLMFPKIIFSVANTLVYTFLIYLIYKHARVDKEDKPILLPLIHLFMYFLTPVFGQTTLWMIGSCNYLWTTTIIVFFLLQYRKGIKDTKLRIVLMFLLGIIAGWTNENTAVGLIVIAVLLMLSLNLEVTKKKKLKLNIVKYQISGIIGSVIGFLTMILAPGNYARNALFVNNDPFIIRTIKRAIEYTYCLYDNILPLILIIVVLVTIYAYYKKKVDIRVWIYSLGAFLATYAMVMAPNFAERSWFGIVVFLNIAIFTLMFNLEQFNKIFKYIIIDLVIILAIFYIKDYSILAKDIYRLRNTWNDRIEVIEKSKGKELEFDQFIVYNEKNPNYGIADIYEDKEIWPNNVISDYFNIKSIKGLTPVNE